VVPEKGHKTIVVVVVAVVDVLETEEPVQSERCPFL